MKLKFCLFVYFFISFCYSQTIKGVVTDVNGNPLIGIVTIKNIKNPQTILQFYSTNYKGEYNILLAEPIDSAVIEAKVYSYEDAQKKIFNIRNQGLIVENFKLISKINVLKEVIISDDKPIKIKKDTTIYNPDSFKDGSERVVEDLLRKLPGIQIEANGTIKFKGKNIKKMLLDGDDLFDSQYTVGSRNIDVNMVEKVEAIENFNTNSLLKGLESSDDVALNLKFKKGLTKMSGEINLGLGYKEKYNLSATEMLLNTKHKSFAVLSYNNIGTNNSPYDFYSNLLSVESLNENKFVAKEVVNQGDFNSPLDHKFHLINNNFYTSINSLYKFSKKISAKVNLNLYNDKLSKTSINETYFSTLEENFSYYQKENFVKSPELYNANIYLKNNVSKKFNWEYEGKLDYQKIRFKNRTNNNDVLQFNDVVTKKIFAKQNLNLTKRIDEKNGIEASLLYSHSNAPQNYILTPGNSIFEDSISKQNHQYSNFNKSIFSSKITFINKCNNFKWIFKTGYYNEQNKYNSLLQTIGEKDNLISNKDFQNDLNFNYDFPFFEGNMSFNAKKLGFKVGIDAKYFNIQTEDKVRDEALNNKKITFSPMLSVFYRLTKQANILSSYSYNQIAPQETNFFEGIVQSSYSGFKNNEANIEFLKTHNFNFNYNYSNPFNLTYLRIGINYNLRENNYFDKSLITPNYIVNTSFQLPLGNRDYSANFSGEKYFHFLRTSFKLTTNYAISNQKNILNNSDLREIRSRSLQIDFLAKFKIEKKVFFENSITYNSNSYLLADIKNTSFSSFKNTFKTIYKINNRFRSVTTVSNIIPDLSFRDKYNFLDTELTFTSKNKKFEYSIIARNLTNNKNFATTSISDYSRSFSSHNLIDRFVLMNISFKL